MKRKTIETCQFCTLLSCLLFFVVTPIARGAQATPTGRPTFEAATIKPHGPDGPGGVVVGGSCHGIDSKYDPGPFTPPPQGRCVFTRMPLTALLTAAYFPVGTGNPRRFKGGPSWVDSEFWDVQAKAEDTANTMEAQLREMLQTLLKERFNLQFHQEPSEVQGFALVIAKNGLKIKEDASGQPSRMQATGEDYNFLNWPMQRFAQYLTRPAGGQVVDKTGLSGGYTFSFHMPPPLATTAEGVSDAGPSIFTVVEEQLGLRLEHQRVPIDVIVIDAAERPHD